MGQVSDQVAHHRLQGHSSNKGFLRNRIALDLYQLKLRSRKHHELMFPWYTMIYHDPWAMANRVSNQEQGSWRKPSRLQAQCPTAKSQKEPGYLWHVIAKNNRGLANSTGHKNRNIVMEWTCSLFILLIWLTTGSRVCSSCLCVCCWLRFWSWYNVYYCAAVGHTVVRTSMFVSGALPHKGISQKNLSEKMNAIHKCPRKMLETLAWKSVTLQCHTHAGNFVKWRVKFGYCITTSIFHRQSFWSCSLELCRKLAHENTLKPNNLAQITCMVHMGKCKSWHFVPPNGLTKIFHECALENSCWHSSPYFEK